MDARIRSPTSVALGLQEADSTVSKATTVSHLMITLPGPPLIWGIPDIRITLAMRIYSDSISDSTAQLWDVDHSSVATATSLGAVRILKYDVTGSPKFPEVSITVSML